MDNLNKEIQCNRNALVNHLFFDNTIKELSTVIQKKYLELASQMCTQMSKSHVFLFVRMSLGYAKSVELCQLHEICS